MALSCFSLCAFKLLQAQPQPVAMRPQVAVATSPAVMPRNQTPGQIIQGPQQQLWQLNSGQSHPLATSAREESSVCVYVCVCVCV